MSVDEGPAWLHRQVGWLRASGVIRDGALGAAELLTMAAAEHVRTGAVDRADRDVAAARPLSRSFGGLAWTDAALDRLEFGVAVATGNHAAVDRIAADVRAQAASAADGMRCRGFG